MICPDCHGSGIADPSEWGDARLNCPCEGCGGSGIAHCCEGDSAMNETEDAGRRAE